MKARVKATGDIVEVYHYGKSYYIGYIGEKPVRIFYPEELDLLDNDPDYWARLEHQYAGMAMQALLQNAAYCHYEEDKLAYYASLYARALVEKIKEKK